MEETRHDWVPPLLFVGLLAWLFVLGCLLGSCAHVPLAPDGELEAAGLPRLYCVEHDAGTCTIYRSAQPTALQFRALQAKFGLKSVLKLNTALPFDGGHDELPPGVELYDDPISPAGPLTPHRLQEIEDDLDAMPKPALVHCKEGVDRTGLVVAVHRTRHGTLAFAAFNEWIAYGSHRLSLLEDAFEDETGYRGE